MTKKRYFAYRSFWPELETMKEFREKIGVDTFNVMISNTANSLGFPYTKYPPVWKWNGVYDLDTLRQQLDDVIAVIPDAKFILLIDLNTPHWWTRFLGAFGVRYDSYYELGKISACEIWRRDTAEYLRVVLEYTQKHYGSRVCAYVLGAGGATEWHDRSRYEESIYRLAAYRRWRKEKGLPPADIPARMKRDAGSIDFDNDYVAKNAYYNGVDPTGGAYDEIYENRFGLLREPATDKEVIEYVRFCSELNADTASWFLARARMQIPRNTELGLFFGYAFDNWSLSAGHLAYEKLFKDENLDFLIAPLSNYNNNIGSGSHPASIHGTIVSSGKRMLNEMDQKTACRNRRLADCYEMPAPSVVKEVKWDKKADGKEMANNFTFGCGNGWDTPEAIAAGLKRDCANSLIWGDSLWLFDMWGGFYQGEKVYDALRRCREIWDEESHIESAPAASALVVVDPENMALLNDLNQRCGLFHQIPTSLLAKNCVPFERCSFSDLTKIDLSAVRLVVLSHPFTLSAEKLQILSERVCCNGRTVLWCYGCCFDAAGKYAPERNQEICGIPFDAKGVTCRSMGDWRSVFVHKIETMTENDMLDILQKAGVKRLTTPPRPVAVNERLLTVHTAVPENIKVHLPRFCEKVTELFSGREWKKTQELEISSSGPDSFLFRME